MVEVVAAQGRIPARREHFEDAAVEFEERRVEGAAPQVVDQVDAFRTVVEPVGECGGGGFVQKTEHVEVREARRVLRRLTLRVVEVGGHRDDGPHEVAAQARFGARGERLQDFGAHFDRALHARRGADREHRAFVDDVVGKARQVREVFAAAADQALRARDRVLRVVARVLARFAAHRHGAVGLVAHDGREQRLARLVRDALGFAAPNGRDDRIRGPEVDPDRETVFVGCRGKSGLGDLKERHQCRFLSVVTSSARGSARRTSVRA